MADHDWIGPTLERIAGLVAMPGRDNSYNCAKVPSRTAHSAVETLMRHMRPWTPAPRVMPTAEGGLVLEWHDTDVDLVLELNGSPAGMDPHGSISREEWEKGVEEAMTKLDAIHMEPKP